MTADGSFLPRLASVPMRKRFQGAGSEKPTGGHEIRTPSQIPKSTGGKRCALPLNYPRPSGLGAFEVM